MSKYIFTSESVTEGHPDKVADKISDATEALHITAAEQSVQVQLLFPAPAGSHSRQFRVSVFLGREFFPRMKVINFV